MAKKKKGFDIRDLFNGDDDDDLDKPPKLSKEERREIKAVKHRKKAADHLESLLRDRHDGNSTAALEIRRMDDDFDKIFKHYTLPGAHQISDKLHQQLKRWIFARVIYSDDRPKSDWGVINALIKEFDISASTARMDVINMKRLFTSVEKVNYEFEKAMHIERLKDNLSRAEKFGVDGMKAIPALFKEIREAMGYGDEKEEGQKPVDVNINVMIDPSLVGAVKVDGLESKILTFIEKSKVKAKKEHQFIDFQELDDQQPDYQEESNES